MKRCPNPECRYDSVRSNLFASSNGGYQIYVYCPECKVRGPEVFGESIRKADDEAWRLWDLLPRIDDDRNRGA